MILQPKFAIHGTSFILIIILKPQKTLFLPFEINYTI